MNKSILLEQTVLEIEGCLKERDTSIDLGSSPANGDDASRSRNGNGTASSHRLDKRQIEQRIEEDRERHKRMRESMWAVPGTIEEEAMKLLEETSDLGEDDHILGREEWEEFQREAEMSKCHHLRQRDAATNGSSSH